jgi:hypothetical protein
MRLGVDYSGYADRGLYAALYQFESTVDVLKHLVALSARAEADLTAVRAGHQQLAEALHSLQRQADGEATGKRCRR